MKHKVVLTRRWPEQVEKALAEKYDCTFNPTDTPFTAEQYQNALLTADALLPTVTDKLDADAMNVANPRTKIIANFGVGFSHIDLDTVKSHNIVITNTPDVLSDCTADIAMTLLLMAARRAGEGERELRSSQWTGWRPTHLMGKKVSGKTLGIVGFGRIGRAMAKRAHAGFGMNIVVHNRSPVAADLLSSVQARQLATLDEVMATADFISIHCPGGAENTHLINEQRLSMMKPGGILINTARGEVIDESALIAAMNSDQIGGIGLDVFQNEPEIDPRFLSLPNTVLLPHLGSATEETRDGMGYRVVENLDQFFNGKSPADRVI